MRVSMVRMRRMRRWGLRTVSGHEWSQHPVVDLGGEDGEREAVVQRAKSQQVTRRSALVNRTVGMCSVVRDVLDAVIAGSGT